MLQSRTDSSAAANAFRTYAREGEEPAFAAANMRLKLGKDGKVVRKQVARMGEKGVYADALFEALDALGGEHKFMRVQYGDGYWWNLFGFAGLAKGSDHKVYLAIPPAQIGAELAFVLQALKADPRFSATAAGIKIAGEAAQLARPDRFCVSFNDAGAALAFAAQMEARLAQKGYPPGKPGLAGSNGWPHVGLGHEISGVNHADRAAHAIAEASFVCQPPERSCVCQIFVTAGIHPETLMPVGGGYPDYDCP